MPTIEETRDKQKAFAEQDKLFSSINAYREKFNNLPDVFMLKVPTKNIVKALEKAIKDGKAYTDEEWRKELGLGKASPGNLA